MTQWKLYEELYNEAIDIQFMFQAKLFAISVLKM